MVHDPSPAARLYAIAEQALCIGCGLCQSIAGPDKIRVVKAANGYERPVVVGDLDHETVDRIYDVCPGTRIEGLPERADRRPETKIDNVWGPWRRMVLAWAGDPEMRFEGATGGVLTALAGFLLASKRVDFVLHVRASVRHPTFGERHLSFTRKPQVLEAAGSRYGPTATLDRRRRGAGTAAGPSPSSASPATSPPSATWRATTRGSTRLVKYWLTPGLRRLHATRCRLDAFLRRAGIAPAAVTGFKLPRPGLSRDRPGSRPVGAETREFPLPGLLGRGRQPLEPALPLQDLPRRHRRGGRHRRRRQLARRLADPRRQP